MLRTPPPQTFPSETLSLDELFLKGKAGSITLDAQGITLNGNIFLKGPVVVQGEAQAPGQH